VGAVDEVVAPFEVTVGAEPDGPERVNAFAAAGVDRLVVSPWRRSREWSEGLHAFAERVGL